MAVYCGIDWAEDHHDIALVDGEGRLVGRRRIAETLDGFAELAALLAEAGDCAEEPIPVAIETPRGLLVAALRAIGRPVYLINPLAVARYRERTSLSGRKSDHVDAMTLANILRTDQHLHRPLPADSQLARSISVLARAYQDSVWRRTKLVQELRAQLREFHPGFLTAFATSSGMSTTGLASADARAVLTIAASPPEAATVSKARIETALRRSGRKRRIPTLAGVSALRVPQPRQAPLVEQAMRTHALALLGVLNAVCDAVDQFTAALVGAFQQHPDHEVITSFPGLADVSGAIVLAEIGDDRSRFIDDRAAGLRRLRPGDPRFGQVPHRRAAAHQEQPARRDRPLLGVHRRRPPLTGSRALPAPPRYGICSTACSANCTTACAPARPTTRSRPSRTRRPTHPNRLPLDS